MVHRHYSCDIGALGRQIGHNGRFRTLSTTWVCCSALLLGAGCGRASDSTNETVAASRAAVTAADSTLSTANLTDAEKRNVILGVLERFVPFAESFWRTSDISEPNTGRYDAVGSGVTQPRGAGDIAFAYVTLLMARPEQTSFGGVSRAVMIDHTIQSIRHEAFTNTLSGKSYKKWGGDTWQASLETYSWAFAAYQLWGQLDEETRALVRKVVGAEANILITKKIATGEEGDTGAEDNGWNSTTPALAAVMFPDDPNAAAWHTTAQKLAINASSTTADATDTTTLVDGQPLSAWMASVNLHPDLTLENHGFFNPIYQQVTHVDINDAAIAYGSAGKGLPEAFSFRALAVWEAVLMHLASDEGDFIMPAGQDWTSKDFQHLEYLGILATRLQRGDASVLESRALKLVQQRQATHANGSMLGNTQIGYETMLIKRLAATYWTHQLFGPSPLPDQAEFDALRATASGVKVFPYSDFIAARLGQAFVSMSWDPAKPMGLVVPNSAAHENDPMFTYYAPSSLIGSASGTIGPHNCDCGSDRFSTAGTIGTRRFSMTAFPDGITLLLDRGTGSTFTYSLESIAGVTGGRSIWSAAGENATSITGDWVNLAERLGVIVKGGEGFSVTTVTGTNNQIVVTGSTGTGSGNRGAILMPNTDHARTAALEPYASQPSTPTDWSALAARAPDESLRLAVARWAGPEMTPIELSDARGAPVTKEDATLAEGKAVFTAHLGVASSYGDTIRFFVDSAVPLRGQQQSETAAIVRNPNEDDATVNVTYTPATGTPETVQKVVIGGEETVARVVEGDLTMAGAELESLVDARNQLTTLRTQLPQGTCRDTRDGDDDRGRGRDHDWDRDCDRDHHSHHGDCHGYPGNEAQTAIDEALRALDEAIAEAKAIDPSERRLLWAIEHARHAVDRLEHYPAIGRLSRELRDVIRTTAQAVETELREAATASRAVTAWAAANNLAQPGEMLEIQVTLLNRGTFHVRRGSVALAVPDGWAPVAPVAAFDSLRPSESVTVNLQIPVPVTATVGSEVALTAEVSYTKGCHEGAALADLTATIDPVIDLLAGVTKLPLGIRGRNQAPITLTNLADHPLDITLMATSPDGVSVENNQQVITVPAGNATNLALVLRDDALLTGTGTLSIAAKTPAGATVTSAVTLSYSDDMALNTVGAPWPLATATSNQTPYPPSFAFDGNSSTFWVSGGTASGQGPTPTQPIVLAVDFGAQQSIGTVVMVPRQNYGPKAYTIEVSNDGTTWAVAASVPSAPNATVTTTLPTAVIARYLRLQMTAAWDRIQPPRNVQIIALNVKAPAN